MILSLLDKGSTKYPHTYRMSIAISIMHALNIPLTFGEGVVVNGNAMALIGRCKLQLLYWLTVVTLCSYLNTMYLHVHQNREERRGRYPFIRLVILAL
jgi:hypothetical protein